MSEDREKNRDWDREMREVDRLLAKLPNADPTLSGGGSVPTVKRPLTTHPTGAPPSGGQWLGTWARVVLGVLIGVGMTQWPYTHGCGLWLFFYLTGVLAVLAAGLWSGISSWKRRLGLAHVMAQLLVVWGLVLAAREILPRVGYAKAEAPWLCPDVTPIRRSPRER